MLRQLSNSAQAGKRRRGPDPPPPWGGSRATLGWRQRCALLQLIVATLLTDACAQDAAPPRTLREVQISTGNVFSAEQADGNPFFWLVNALHTPTRTYVVERELFFRPGDAVTESQVAELERNLRATRAFRSVSTRLVDAGDGQSDLFVDCRDRFSLNAQVGISSVGGATRLNAQLTESNLFGTHKEVVLAWRGSSDERTAFFRYNDPQLFDTWHQAHLTIGETDEGRFGSLEVERPFKHLADPLSYGVLVATEQRDLDYFDRGESIAQLPEDRQELRARIDAGSGPRDLRQTLGFDLRWRQLDYQPASGSDAAFYRTPPDSRQVEFGPTWSLSWAPVFQQVQALDALDFVEDLPLGVRTDLRLAVGHRDADGETAEWQSIQALAVRIAAAPLPDTWVTAEASGAARLDARFRRGLSSSARAALHAYQKSLPRQTLAASVTYDAADESLDATPQFTLAEDNGLRGYPAREFGGRQRLRINLEDRIDTGAELLSFRLGLVAFFDAGAVHDARHGLSLRRPFSSAGFGLRVGSSALLGRRAVRLDIAWPLDERDGERFGVSVSFSTQQVFEFFGNSEVLRRDF